MYADDMEICKIFEESEDSPVVQAAIDWTDQQAKISEYLLLLKKPST